MTPEQLTTLKAAILAETDTAFVALRSAGETGAMAEWFNQPASPQYFVALPNVDTGQIGKVINYVAFESLTIANRDKLYGFLQLNSQTFDGTRSDVRTLLSADTGQGIFAGSLGGQGAATRAALSALMVRTATRAEKTFAVGAGTAGSPSTPGFLGVVNNDDVVQALNS